MISCINLFAYFSIYICFGLFIHLFVLLMDRCPSTFHLIHKSIHVFIYASIHVHSNLSIHVHMYTYLYVDISIHSSNHLFIHLSIKISTYLFIYLCICQSFHLSIHSSIYSRKGRRSEHCAFSSLMKIECEMLLT